MIKFINTTNDRDRPYTAIENIEMTISEEASLPDLLEAFEGFLKASGYHIPENNYIDIVVHSEESVVEYTSEPLKFTIVGDNDDR